MNDYKINDKWIMDRISSQSSSFSQWISNIISFAEKSLDEVDPKQIQELKKQKDLTALKNIDGELSKAKKELDKAKKDLSNLGSLGKMFSGIGTKMSEGIMDTVEESIKGSLKDQDLDLHLDFLSGKRKSLSSALYDVSKERGIDLEGLLYLISALPDLEAFLYSTSVKKYYRDHTEHALRVAVLGDFLLEQDLGHGNLAGVIADLTELDKNVIKEKYWWITGLIHDIGYPLGKMTTAVNYSLVNQLLKCYPTLDLEFVPFEINLSWRGNQENYLEIIEEGLSKEAKLLIREGAGLNSPNIIPKNTEVYLKKKEGHPEFNFQSSVNLDHGVLSALSLLNGLGTPDEIKNNDEFYGYILAAKAIALHNFKAQLKEYVFDSHPLAFFLMLVDELQEWGRPIPIQVRDSYFTAELKKVNLMDDILLNLDEFSWLMKFKDEKAKKIMNFNFNMFSEEKEKTFKRLNRGEHFRETEINLQNIKKADDKKSKEEIIDHTTIKI